MMRMVVVVMNVEILMLIHMILSLSWEKTGLGLGEGRDLPNKVVVTMMVVTMIVVTMMVMTHDTECKQARKGEVATRRVIFGQSLITTNSFTRFEPGMNIFHIFIFLQFQNKDVRPPFTYAALIKQVRSQSTDTAMLQQGIQLLLLLSTLSYSVASLIDFNRFARNLT